MTIRDLFQWVCVVTGLMVWRCQAPCMARVVNYDDHPLLAEALSHDLEMNGGDYVKADRTLAEKQYLAYIEARKDLPSFQKARIYTQLGALYATAINENKGEERDLKKARSYFEKAIVSEPNRVGLPTLRARSFLSELKAQAGFDRVKSLMGYYEYLGKLDEKTVRRLWLPERPEEEPLGSNDPNVRSAYSAAIPQQRVAAMMNYIAALKRLQVRNSITNAEHMAEPATGLLYIMEHLAADAPEREEVRKALSKLPDGVANDELNTVLSSSKPKVTVYRDASLAPKEQASRGAPDQGDEAIIARRRFIPHLTRAVKSGDPFILDFKSGKCIRAPVKDNFQAKEVFDHLMMLGKGDLAWDGRLLTTRKAGLFTTKQEAARPLKCVADTYGESYNLPEKSELPYTFLASDKEGTHYLVRVVAVVPEGIEVWYRGVPAGEVSTYVERNAKPEGGR